jgi:hypothetical protein
MANGASSPQLLTSDPHNNKGEKKKTLLLMKLRGRSAKAGDCVTDYCTYLLFLSVIHLFAIIIKIACGDT